MKNRQYSIDFKKIVKFTLNESTPFEATVAKKQARKKKRPVGSKGDVCIGIDLGTGSMAIAARVNKQIIWHRSLLLDAQTARLAERRKRRAMIRTRIAHRAREYWWNEQAKIAGIPTLKTVTRVNSDTYKISNVDDRLKREHPPTGDETCYNGALLRIMILEGRIDELEPWQIYKAIHSAIQKRGYDHDVPWKNSEKDKNQASKSADKSPEVLMDEFLQKFTKIVPDSTKHYCCYFDAYQSGLWNPRKGIISQRQSFLAAQRGTNDWAGYTPPRSMVVGELSRLLREIQKKFPAIDPSYVMHGPSLVEYGSHPRKRTEVAHAKGRTDLVHGRPTDWQGVMGQKIPRFLNRGVGYCVLIPRFKVCKVPTDEQRKSLPPSDDNDPREIRLYPKFLLLSKLKNIRVLKSGGFPEPLTPEECREAFHFFESSLNFTMRDFKRWLANKSYKIAPGMDWDHKGKSRTGRCAYSRPALRMICRWLYEGWDNHEGLKSLKKEFVRGNKNPIAGIVDEDLEWVNRLPPGAWVNAFYVPARPASVNPSESQDGVTRFVEEIRYPVVRHRLGLLLKNLRELKSHLESQGCDLSRARVGLEVIRDESPHTFLGEEALKELTNSIRKNAKINARIQQACDEHGIRGPKGFEQVKLAFSQKFIDPYDIDEFRKGKRASQSSMLAGIRRGEFQADHIVPEALGGPDEMYNKILTRKAFNSKKLRRTPFQWLSETESWSDYLKIVEQLPEKSGDNPGISEFTKRLLTDGDAVQLVSRRTDLQATGYIEKKAQSLIYRVFGWSEPVEKGGVRHVVCVPGATVFRIRKRARLNELLYRSNSTRPKSRKKVRGRARETQPAPVIDISQVKNRSNPKHHILDAAVLTFIPEWALDPSKREFFRLPSFATQDWFESKVIETHFPQRINVVKPSLRETRKGLFVEKNRQGLTTKKWVTVKKHLYETGKGVVEWKAPDLKLAIDKGHFNDHLCNGNSPLTKALKKALNRDGTKIRENLTIRLGAHDVPLKSVKERTEFSDFRHLVQGDGSVLESHPHRGVIVWRERNAKRKTWKVAIVAAWSDAAAARKRILSNIPSGDIEFWLDGEVLSRGTKVEVRANGLRELPRGVYVITETRESGVVVLEGQTYKPSIGPLIDRAGIKVVTG